MSVTARANLSAFPVIKPEPMPGKPTRRRVSPEAGRALEILGHAIDYLADEYIHAGGSFRTHDPQIEAIQLLMSLNRQIYLACPEEPSFVEKCLAVLHIRKESPRSAIQRAKQIEFRRR